MVLPEIFASCLLSTYPGHLHGVAAEAAVRDIYGAVVPAITLEIFDIFWVINTMVKTLHTTIKSHNYTFTLLHITFYHF